MLGERDVTRKEPGGVVEFILEYAYLELVTIFGSRLVFAKSHLQIQKLSNFFFELHVDFVCGTYIAY